MKLRHLFFALLRFTVQIRPSNVWFMAGIIVLCSLAVIIINFQFHHGPSGGEETGLGNSLNEWYLVFCSQFGMLYLSAGATTWSRPFELVPNGEFLLVRPISRRIAYLVPIVLYFVVMISGSVLKVGASIPDPDLHLFLSLSKTSSNEATDNLTLYRKEFPDSTVIHKPELYHDTLVIPLGAVLIALWQLFLAFLFALAMQAVIVVSLPPKIQMTLLIIVSQTPLALLVLNLSGKHTMLMEYAFFFFANHWVVVAAFSLAVFALVQLIALKRIKDLELI